LATGESASELKSLLVVGQKLVASLDLEHLLVTLGAKGIAILRQDSCTHLPATARQVFDVSGAGDTVVAVVAAATTWAEFPAMWGPMLDKVWSFLRSGAPQGLYKRGHNIMLYKDDVPNVEVGVQVSGSFDPVGRVVASALPGGLVATATHTGPIAKLGDTHRAARDWSKANGYLLAGPHWEIYGDPDPSTGDFDVDVYWSLLHEPG